jgi:hypothetical protein
MLFINYLYWSAFIWIYSDGGGAKFMMEGASYKSFGTSDVTFHRTHMGDLNPWTKGLSARHQLQGLVVQYSVHDPSWIMYKQQCMLDKGSDSEKKKKSGLS